MPSDGLPRLASSALIRSAAGSVTDNACMRAISTKLPTSRPLNTRSIACPLCGAWDRLFHPLAGRTKPRDRSGDRIDGEIDLGGGCEAADAQAHRAARRRLVEPERPQHVGRLDARRRAG